MGVDFYTCHECKEVCQYGFSIRFMDRCDCQESYCFDCLPKDDKEDDENDDENEDWKC